MKIDMKKHLLETARIHRDMGDPLSIEEIASIAEDIQCKNFEDIRRLVACDASAASFQSLGQYRTNLLKTLKQVTHKDSPKCKTN